MAIARDATSSQDLTVTTATGTHTCASNAFLVIGTYGSTVWATTVTYAGTQLTKIADIESNTGEYNMTLWYLSAPASGANTINATVTGGSVGYWASSYTGVLGWIDASTNARAGSGTSLTTPFTTATDNDWSVGIFGCSANTLTASTGTNFLFSQLHNTCLGDSNGALTPAGAKSMAVTGGSGTFASVVMTLSPTALPSTIKQDNNAYLGTTTATSMTTAYKINSNTNGILLVWAHNNGGPGGGGDVITGVTYNGVSMTRINSQASNNSDMFDAIYYLLAPATGSNNVVISFSAANQIIGFAASYTGVAQVAPAVVAAQSTNNTATTITTSLTTSVANCWIYATNANNGTLPTAGAGVTHLMSSESPTGNYRQQADSGLIAAAGSYSFTWTSAANTLVGTLTQLAPASSTIAGGNLLLAGVG